MAKIDLKLAFGLKQKSNVVSLRPAVAPKEPYTNQLKFLELHENDKVFERKTTERKNMLIMSCENWEARWKMITVDHQDDLIER